MGSNPEEAIIFILDLLANPVLPCGGLGLVHLMPSRRPVNRQVTARTAMCSISIGPYVHAMSPLPYCMDAMCHPASGATWHPHFAKFAYFINTTERDNFLIRSPFEVKRMPLESSRRALRFGTSFTEIGGIQNFSFLDPPGSFLPTEKLLASKSLD